MKRTTTLATILGALLASPALSLAAARAELRPSDQLTVDTPAQLTITVDDPAARPPSIKLRDADVQYSGSAQKTTIINGDESRETIFGYTLIPHHTGALDIPALRVGNDTTDAIHANVVAATATSASGAQARAQAQANVAEPTRAFLRAELPKRSMYVGEAVPVRIRAYFRAGVAATLQGQPRLASPAYTLAGLSDKPDQRQVDIGGVPYLQVTWNGVMSAAKPTHDAVSLELPVEIAYREARPRAAAPHRSLRDMFGGDPFGGDDAFGNLDAMFDDPFFADAGAFSGLDDMFDTGPTRQQDLTLEYKVPKTSLAELPTTGRPPAFHGAIGSFELTRDIGNPEWRAGEPVTVTYRVTGTGNFDHVAVSGIDASPDWKVYPGKTSAEVDGATGTKTFTQTIVPTHAGALTVPAVSLAYFNPKTKAYATTATQPLAVQVAPGATADTDLAAVSTDGSNATGNRVTRGTTHPSLTPLVRQPLFWLWPAALLALTAVLLVFAWLRRATWARQRLADRRVARRVRAQRHRLGHAVTTHDSAEFFDAARAALQLRLAESWGVRPESITPADVDARLGSDGAQIRDVLEHADNIKYAHHDESIASLERWQTVVNSQLRKLEASR